MSGKSLFLKNSSNLIEQTKQGLCAWEPEGNMSFDLFDCGIQNIEQAISNNGQNNGGFRQQSQESLVNEIRQLKDTQKLSFPIRTLPDNQQSLILERPKDVKEIPKVSKKIITSNSEKTILSTNQYPINSIAAQSKVEAIQRNQEKIINPFQISSRELSPIVQRKLLGLKDQKNLADGIIGSQIQDAITISSILPTQTQKNQEGIKIQLSPRKNPIQNMNSISKYPSNKLLKTQTLIDFSTTKLAKFDIGSYSDIFQTQKRKQLKSLKLKSPSNQPAKDIHQLVKENKDVSKLGFDIQPSKSALVLVKDKIRSSMKKSSLNYCLTSDKNPHLLDSSFSHLPSAMILSNYYQFQVEKRSKSLLKQQQFLSIEGESGFLKSKSTIMIDKKDDKLNTKGNIYISKQRTKHFRALSLQNEAVTNSCMQTQTNFNDICEDEVKANTQPAKQVLPPTQNTILPQKPSKPFRSVSCDLQQQNGILQFPKLLLQSNQISPISSRGSHESLLLRQIVASEAINNHKDHKNTTSSLSLNPSTRKTISFFPNNPHELQRKQIIAMTQRLKV